MSSSNVLNYGVSIRQLLKSVHIDLKISQKFIDEMNIFIDRYIFVLAEMCLKEGKKKTVDIELLSSQMDKIFPGEIGTHNKSECNKAIEKFNSFLENGEEKKGASWRQKTGIVFQVPRVLKHFKTYLSGQKRVNKDIQVFLSASIEYICAEILEFSGRNAIDLENKTLLPKHFERTIENDSELKKLHERLFRKDEEEEEEENEGEIPKLGSYQFEDFPIQVSYRLGTEKEINGEEVIAYNKKEKVGKLSAEYYEDSNTWSIKLGKYLFSYYSEEDEAFRESEDKGRYLKIVE